MPIPVRHLIVGRAGLIGLVGLGILSWEAPVFSAEKTATHSVLSDLQGQIKSTASKVTPAVVNIASTVIIRAQLFSDEGLPFGLFSQPTPRHRD